MRVRKYLKAKKSSACTATASTTPPTKLTASNERTDPSEGTTPAAEAVDEAWAGAVEKAAGLAVVPLVALVGVTLDAAVLALCGPAVLGGTVLFAGEGFALCVTFAAVGGASVPFAVVGAAVTLAEIVVEALAVVAAGAGGNAPAPSPWESEAVKTTASRAQAMALETRVRMLAARE